MVKSPTLRAALVTSYASMKAVYRPMREFSSEMIQRSISGLSAAGMRDSPYANPSMFAYMAKKAYVFTSVPKNFRWTSRNPSSSNIVGRHGGLVVTRYHRVASAPYCAMISNGLTVFPFDLDIF